MRICITHSLRKQRKWHNIRTGRRGDFPVGFVFREKICYTKKYDKKGQKSMPLTHFDAEGKARMVDVTEKKETVREATATGKIKVSRDVYDAIEAGTVGKGDVLSVATTAGIMGVKRTADLIPMCHILPITNCKIRFEKDPKNLEITCFCTVKVTGKTGVEMEALTGVSVALLTIYDMCKALDKFMEIQDIYLCKKTGGKSGEIVNPRMEDRGEEGR